MIRGLGDSRRCVDSANTTLTWSMTNTSHGGQMPVGDMFNMKKLDFYKLKTHKVNTAADILCHFSTVPHLRKCWENVLNVPACGKWNIWVQSTMPHRVFPPANTFTPETFTFYTFMVSGPKLWPAAYWVVTCTVVSISLRPQWKSLTLSHKPGHIVDNNINNDILCFRSFLPSGSSKIKVCYPAMLLTCISALGYCQLPLRINVIFLLKCPLIYFIFILQLNNFNK